MDRLKTTLFSPVFSRMEIYGLLFLFIALPYAGFWIFALSVMVLAGFCSVMRGEWS